MLSGSEMKMESADTIDLHLLRLLQEDGRRSIASLAEEVGLSEAPTWRRVRRLESEGWITGYHAIVDRRKAGLDVLALVSVRFASHELEVADRFAELVGAMPEVMSCHNVTGDVDYQMTVLTPDLESYERFTRKLRSIPGVVSIQSHLSLREIKSSHRLPLG